jgi:hypothetical protein
MTTTDQHLAGDPPHPHRAGVYDWIVFLVTGPEDKLMAWQSAAMFVVELFDRRQQTVRCRAHGDATDRGQRAYERAVELAKQHDVTLQDLVDTGRRENKREHRAGAASVTVADCVEEYPVVHLGSDGIKWPDYLPKQTTKKRKRK